MAGAWGLINKSMLDRLSDCVLRIAQADAAQLKEIYEKEVKAKGWSDEERSALILAVDTRMEWLNRVSVGLQVPRWRTTI